MKTAVRSQSENQDFYAIAGEKGGSNLLSEQKKAYFNEEIAKSLIISVGKSSLNLYPFKIQLAVKRNKSHHQKY